MSPRSLISHIVTASLMIATSTSLAANAPVKPVAESSKPVIPATAAVAPKPAPTVKGALKSSLKNGKGTYLIQPGDTLTRIATLYDLKIDQLMVAAGLSNSNIIAGTALQIDLKRPATAAKPVEKPAAKPVAQSTGTNKAIASASAVKPLKSGGQLLMASAPLPADSNLLPSAEEWKAPSNWKLSGPELGYNPKGFTHAGGRALKTYPDRAQMLGVGHVMQTLNNCGPAAVLAVMEYYDINTSTQALLSRVLRQGSKYTQIDPISAFLQTHGLQAPVITGSNNEDLIQFLNKGIPVIVLQYLTVGDKTPHLRVVTGYDRAQGRFWVSDSMYGAGASIDFKSFDQLWNVQGRVMIPVYKRQAPASET